MIFTARKNRDISEDSAPRRKLKRGEISFWKNSRTR